ncbi:MAG: tRNA (adenosine(37)-N6)-threonylcarbamoyltransferase complex dimerization subunit type 1 TsaB [Nitrospirales bacterium]
MVILALETGTSSPSVGVLKDRTLLVSAVCQPGQSLTSQLLPTIDRLLVSAGMLISDCQGLAVSIGPGSFTGLRVGLATMSALRLALQIPLVGVSTLEGLAWNQVPTTLPIFSTVYIKPGSLYWGIYQWADETMTLRGDEAMGTVADSLQYLKGDHMVVGDGWSRNRELFGLDQGGLIPPSQGQESPSAQGIGLAGFGLLERGQWLPEGTSPHYLQPSYAEAAIDNTKVSGE